MSLIYYKCPECSKKFQSDSEKSGQEVICNRCGHSFLIPEKSTFKPDSNNTSEPYKTSTNIQKNEPNKYPFLAFYCGLTQFFSGLLILFAVIGFLFGLGSQGSEKSILIQSSIVLIGVGLGGFASAAIIQVLMDIEKNTRITANNTKK